ncbi:MAG: O-antigen ligase family protein [Lentisphaeria bacterium]|nr:O-antigen ligase family protein [Lentisphaeria bacterium]
MTEPAEITQETSQQKISFLLCGFFLICAMLWNPGIYTSLGKASYLPFFTPAALSFLAAAVLFFGPEKPQFPKYIVIAVSGFCLIVLGQFCMHVSRWSIAQGGESLWWVAIPALACAHRKSFRQLLPVYVLAIGGYGFLYSAVGDLRGIWNAGITGNVNWTAALFGMTMIFLGWFTLECKQAGQRKMSLGLGIVGELLLFWQVWKIGSKGAFLAAGLTALLFFFLRSTAKIRKLLIVLALLGLLAGSFWAVKHTDAIGRFINDDGRVILWENAVSLIADHPLFGVRQGSYENEYMTYRNADYFFILNPAARSNHPHNHLLFMAGSWGLTGLILWGILLFAPLAVMIRKYYRHETVDPLETACFLTLCYAVLHGSLDIVMESMPTGFIALLCLGILARHLADPENRQCRSSSGKSC